MQRSTRNEDEVSAKGHEPLPLRDLLLMMGERLLVGGPLLQTCLLHRSMELLTQGLDAAHHLVGERRLPRTAACSPLRTCGGGGGLATIAFQSQGLHDSLWSEVRSASRFSKHATS